MQVVNQRHLPFRERAIITTFLFPAFAIYSFVFIANVLNTILLPSVGFVASDIASLLLVPVAYTLVIYLFAFIPINLLAWFMYFILQRLHKTEPKHGAILGALTGLIVNIGLIAFQYVGVEPVNNSGLELITTFGIDVLVTILHSAFSGMVFCLMMRPVRTDVFGEADAGQISQSVIDFEADTLRPISLQENNDFLIGGVFETPKRYVHHHYVYKIHDDRRITGFYAYRIDATKVILDYFALVHSERTESDALMHDFLTRIRRNKSSNVIQVTVKPSQQAWLETFGFEALDLSDNDLTMQKCLKR